jgi:glycosyltransferase involved in cell wall biosynthesis
MPDRFNNSTSPLVSVVMSVYNGETYLREAIDSVLHQSYSNFEFIIINDGSSDKSLPIIKSYTDNRIILIDNDGNKGLIYSLNKGLEIAKGAYIARMDADDVCLPERFDLQVNQFLNNPKAMIIGSDYYLLTENKLRYIKNINDSDYQKAVLLFAPCFCHPTVMMKNIFNEKSIYYNQNFIHAEDYKLWTDLYAFGDYLNINKPLLKYRNHSSQISNLKKDSQLTISSLIREQYLKQLNFSLSPHQFEILNFIGNNNFIESISTLMDIEKCLLYLQMENTIKKSFNNQSFKRFMFKFWLDSCGNTNLGLTAYSQFYKSEISTYLNLSFIDKSVFLAKCIIRKFK